MISQSLPLISIFYMTSMQHFLGLHRGMDLQIWANSKLVDREEILKMESSRSLDQNACPDCNCAYLDKKSRIRWAKCNEKRHYLCEYKGNISSLELNIGSDLSTFNYSNRSIMSSWNA